MKKGVLEQSQNSYSVNKCINHASNSTLGNCKVFSIADGDWEPQGGTAKANGNNNMAMIPPSSNKHSWQLKCKILFQTIGRLNFMRS